MIKEKLYARRDSEALGELYLKHVMAMIAEQLHDKSAIAAELAFRDAEIERLQTRIDELKRAQFHLAYGSGPQSIDRTLRPQQVPVVSYYTSEDIEALNRRKDGK